LRQDGHLYVALNGTPEALAKSAAMARFLEQRTGLALPVRTYTQIFVHGDAAQEAVGLALIGEDALHDPDSEWVFIHELAHQWFGVSLKCADFDDFWLNEGFATFFVAAWFEQTQGRAAYEEELAHWQARSNKVRAEGKDAPLSLAPPGQPRPHTPESKLQPRGVTYFRGALFLHQLRTELGDDTFWAVIREYVRTNAGRDVTSEHLRRALESVTKRDWRDEFQQRVYSVQGSDPKIRK
jgi:aminopeptidase N